MDVKIYAGFIAAAELASITRAAERLNITQSALSRQIAALEDALSLRLFEKAGRNVRLSAQGEALFARINGVVVAERGLRSFASDLAQSKAGLLRVGACSQLIERYFPVFLGKWRNENPGIDIRLEDGGGPELAEKLRAGGLHLTISAAPSAPIEIFQSLHLGKLAFLAVGTADVLPAGKQPIELTDLLALPMLTLNKRHASREVLDAACRLTGMVPRIVLESYSPHTLFSMAQGGNGVAVVPSSAQLAGTALISRPIALRGDLIEFEICAMWDGRTELPAYGQRFVAALAAHIAQESTVTPMRPNLSTKTGIAAQFHVI